MLAGIGKAVNSFWRPSSVCDARAASSAKSIPRMRTEVTLNLSLHGGTLC